MSINQILCGRGHRHPSVAEVRACYSVPAASETRPAATHGSGKYVRFMSAEPTPAQLDSIRRLGGTCPPGATRGEASSIIGRLLEGRTKKKEMRKVTTSREFPFPSSMLFNIREGRFATSVDGSDKLTFTRLSIVKPLKSSLRQRAHVGAMKIQTQHGDDLITRFYVYPDGRFVTMSNMTAPTVAGHLMLIAMDQRETAHRYGVALGQCCRCGKSLTDERSRYYGIGPECEKHWSSFIGEVDEVKGAFVPSTVGSALVTQW